MLVQFMPPDTENMLATLERNNAGGKSVKQFYKTVFGVRPSGNGWETDEPGEEKRRVKADFACQVLVADDHPAERLEDR